MLHGTGCTACSLSQRVRVEARIVGERIGLQIGPQILDGVEFWGIGRQVFDMCRTRQDALIDECAGVGFEIVPDQDHRHAQLVLQMLKEIHGVLGIDVCIRMQPKVQGDPIPAGRDAQCGDGRDFSVTASALSKHGGVSTQTPGATHQGRHQQARFVEKDDGGSQACGVFFTRGQSFSTQVRMRCSSRSIARRVGFCGENPKPCNRRLT